MKHMFTVYEPSRNQTLITQACVFVATWPCPCMRNFIAWAGEARWAPGSWWINMLKAQWAPD